MYDDLLDDPKVQRLPPLLFKAWVNLLCLASKNGGTLPSMDHAAFAMRMDEDALIGVLNDLVARGLIDATDDAMTPHNWEKRQFKSDKDDTAADRQKAKRDRDRAAKESHAPVTRDVTDKSRSPETDTDTDTEAERADARAEGHREVADRILCSGLRLCSFVPKRFLFHVFATTKLSTDQQSSFDAIASRWRNKQPNAPPPPTQVPVIEGSEAWAAWQRAKGKRLPTTDLKDERGNAIGKRGWYFPTEFPDQKGAAA